MYSFTALKVRSLKWVQQGENKGVSRAVVLSGSGKESVSLLPAASKGRPRCSPVRTLLGLQRQPSRHAHLCSHPHIVISECDPPASSYNPCDSIGSRWINQANFPVSKLWIWSHLCAHKVTHSQVLGIKTRTSREVGVGGRKGGERGGDGRKVSAYH